MDTSEINNVIERVEKQLVGYNSAIELMCILHKTGKRKKACHSLLKGHEGEDFSAPLKKILLPWIKSENNDQVSNFLGIIHSRKVYLSGVIKRDKLTGVIALNLDNYSNLKHLEVDLYRLSWDIIKASKKLRTIDNKSNYQRVIMPNIHNKKVLSHNLQADIFAATAYSLLHKQNYVKELGIRRAKMTLSRGQLTPPQNYPYIMTLDQTEYLLKQLQNKKHPRLNCVGQAWKASRVISQTMKQDKLKVWHTFAEHAQSMITLGYPPPITLSISIDRNDSVETKKLAIQISSLSGVKPAMAKQSHRYYNPYRSDEYNETFHKGFVNDIFETLLTRSIFENTAKPLYDYAERQNTQLKKGQFIGWCAAALQETADILEQSIKHQQPATQTARDVFKRALNKISWDMLKNLNKELLAYKIDHNDRFKNRDFIDFLEANPKYKLIKESALKSFRKETVKSPNLQPKQQNDGLELFQEFERNKPIITVTKH